MIADQQEEEDDPSNTMLAEAPEDINEDDLMDTLIQEGDTDAILIADFEAAATDVLQGDEELAKCLECLHRST